MPVIAIAVVVGFGVASVFSAANLKKEEVASVLRQRPAECGHAVGAYYAAFPSAKIYAGIDPALTVLGEVDAKSGYGADGWFWRFRDDFEVYRDRAVADLRPYEPACLIVSHIAGDEDKVLLAALSKDRTCTIGAAAKGARLYVCRAAVAAQMR